MEKPWYRRMFKDTESATPEVQEQRTIIINRATVGVSGTEKYGGVYNEDYFRTMNGQQKAKEYDKMRRGDARIKMCLSAVSNPIRSANCTWVAGEATEEAQKHADFLNFIFKEDIGEKQIKPWGVLLNEAISVAAFGHAIFERAHKVVQSHPVFGSYVGLKAFGWRNPKTIMYFKTDANGELAGVVQQAYGDVPKSVEMDAQFLTILTIDREGDLYEGVSLLRPCYGPWSRKQTDLKLKAIGNEKNAIPTPKVKVPAGKENSEEYANMVATLEALTSHESNYITYPEGWDLDFATSSFDPEKLIKSIQFENEEMAFAFLANFLSLGQGGNGGAYALSKDLSDFFEGGILYIADLISTGFGAVGKELIELNFGPQEKYPKLQFQGIDDAIGSEFGTLLKTLGDGKFLTADDNIEKELRRRMKLPEMREEDIGKRDKKPDPVIPPNVPIDPNVKPDPEVKPDPKVKTELTDWEKKIQLAESKAQKTIGEAQDRVRYVLKKHVRLAAEGLVEDVMKNYRAAGESTKIEATNGVTASGRPAYYAELKQVLSEIALEAIDGARREVPKAKKVKLSEFDKLPPRIKKRVASQSRLLADTTLADLEKHVFFQFGDSAVSTDSEAIIEKDLFSAAETYSNGASITAQGGNAGSRVVNEARSAFFFDDEVLKEIESFTFVNGDPVSEICQSLAGQTFAKDDPEAARLYPPLHMNCKSYISVNLVGAKDNPPVRAGGLQTKFVPSL